MRFGASETNCQSCQRIYAADDLDRFLWCPECRAEVKRRGVRWGRLVGIVAGVAVALYVVLIVKPVRLNLLWALPPLMTYVLTSRIAVSVAQGYYRSRGSIKVETQSESETEESDEL